MGGEGRLRRGRLKRELAEEKGLGLPNWRQIPGISTKALVLEE